MSTVRELRLPHQSPCHAALGNETPSKEHQRDRERIQWHWITEGSHGQKEGKKGVSERERGSVSESDFPSPVTRSSDSFVAGSLSSRLWLPECIRGPVCNLTSQYWNSNASSHSINCCLVIGFQTCRAGILDVLASLIMLCHGGWRESSNYVKMKGKKNKHCFLKKCNVEFHKFICCGPSQLCLQDNIQHVKPSPPYACIHTCTVHTAHPLLFCSSLFNCSFLPI